MVLKSILGCDCGISCPLSHSGPQAHSGQKAQLKGVEYLPYPREIGKAPSSHQPTFSIQFTDDAITLFRNLESQWGNRALSAQSMQCKLRRA